MKKQIIISISSFLMALVLFTGCKKNDGPIPIDLTRVPTPLVLKSGGDVAIDVVNAAAFKAKFSVGLYFPDDIKPAKFDIVIMKNGNTGNVKVFKTDVTTFPSEFEITAAQIETLFGTPIVLNDSYDIGVDVYTQSGLKLEAFPVTGASYASGVSAQPGASVFVRYTAICQYDPDIYQGDFEVVEDEWADFTPGEVVTLVKVDDTHFSFIDPYAEDPTPVVITVNTGTNLVSMPRMKIGSAWGWAVGLYTGAYVATGGVATDNFVAPCDETVTLSVVYGVDLGDFGGSYKLVLKKL